MKPTKQEVDDAFREALAAVERKDPRASKLVGIAARLARDYASGRFYEKGRLLN